MASGGLLEEVDRKAEETSELITRESSSHQVNIVIDTYVPVILLKPGAAH